MTGRPFSGKIYFPRKHKQRFATPKTRICFDLHLLTSEFVRRGQYPKYSILTLRLHPPTSSSFTLTMTAHQTARSNERHYTKAHFENRGTSRLTKGLFSSFNDVGPIPTTYFGQRNRHRAQARMWITVQTNGNARVKMENGPCHCVSCPQQTYLRKITCRLVYAGSLVLKNGRLANTKRLITLGPRGAEMQPSTAKLSGENQVTHAFKNGTLHRASRLRQIRVRT